MNLTVYRVENGDGIGPYMGNILLGEWAKYMMKEHDESSNHPTWKDDLSDDDFKYLKWCGDYIYSSGFISKEHANNWFEGWLIPLEQSGFTVIPYEVEKSKIIHSKSGKQIVFKKP